MISRLRLPAISVFDFCLLTVLSLAASVNSPLAGAEPKPPRRPAVKSPVSAEESLRHFELHPALRIEVAAAEPQVIDPVSIRFDEDGRMWVVEMSDYPNGPQPGESPKSRIRVLEDRDQDGRYETARTFADQLLFATGLQPWKGGAIVTMAGEVAYFRDTDGDGKADVRETWFTGFKQDNPQLRANRPTFALDNHIYIANGLRGGDVIAKKEEWAKEAKPASISGMDFRFDPLSGKYEAVSGNGQFGLTFDDFGNRFVCSNRNPCRHVVLEDRYIKRNPHLVVTSVMQDVSSAGASSRIFPISRAWTTSNLHQGQFTAACGVTIYRGDLLPAEFRGNSLTCDPTGFLVHRDVLKPKGATFTSRPGRKGVEFLASRDEWFRPVNLQNGPDGALYVIDMYRAVIEHPRWVPDELKNRPDNYFGNDRGRIYRIVPAKSKRDVKARRTPNLSRASSAQLVTLLEHPNSWHRETAARLIFERQDKSIQAKLEQLARKGKTAQSRVHALWALEGLGLLSEKTVGTAQINSSSRVREHATRLSEKWIRKGKETRPWFTLWDHKDARLRFQRVLSLGEAGPKTDLMRLGNLATAGKSDPWTRTAALSSLPEKLTDNSFAPFEIFSLSMHLSIALSADGPGAVEWVAESLELIGNRQNKREIVSALGFLGNFAGTSKKTNSRSEWRIVMAGLDGLGRGLARRGKRLTPYKAAVAELLKLSGGIGIDAIFQHAAKIAVAKKEDIQDRLRAIELLQYSGYKTAGPPLTQLATIESNQAVRIAAIGNLAKYNEPEVGKLLLQGFLSQTPSIRRAILDAMLANSNRTRLLLDEIEGRRIGVNELDPTRANRLSRHRDEQIQRRAKKLLAAAIPADRQQVLKDYQKTLSSKSDPKQGREVFRKNCMACHKIADLGVDVAPDISDSRTKKPQQLLISILDPNRAIDSNYFSYTVVTNQGKVLTGIIGTETASSITLRQQENKTVTVLRQDIDQMKSNGVSLMPVGLEKNINVQQMADLISFIKNWRYLDGRIPIQIK